MVIATITWQNESVISDRDSGQQRDASHIMFVTKLVKHGSQRKIGRVKQGKDGLR